MPGPKAHPSLLTVSALLCCQAETRKQYSTHSFIAPVFENVELPRNHGLNKEKEKISMRKWVGFCSRMLENSLWQQPFLKTPRRPSVPQLRSGKERGWVRWQAAVDVLGGRTQVPALIFIQLWSFGCRTRKGRGSRGALTVEELPSSSTSLRTRLRRARNEAGCRGR